jgi:hypothetical protein
MQGPIRKDLAFLLEDFFLLKDESLLMAAAHEILLRLRGNYVSLAHRYKILEEITIKIDEIALHVRNRALGEQTTLTHKRQSAREVDALQFSLSSAYLSVFSDHEMLDEDGALDMEMIAVAMHRALYHLVQMQIWHYQLYSPLPDRMWFNIHLIYREAASYQLENVAIHLVTATGSAKMTLEEQYKRSLLLGTANTACMQPDEIIALYCLLEQWSQAAVLRKQGNRADLYSVYVYSDQGPVYQSLKTPRPRANETWRTLDTSSLSHNLHKIHERLEHNKQEFLAIHYHKISCKNILRLVHTWSAMPTRSHPRKNEQINLQVSFHLFTADDAISSAFVLTQHYSQPEEWLSLNTSPTGFCLTRKGVVLFALQSGQLLKIQDTGADGRTTIYLGVVRWIKHVNQEYDPEIVMGVQLLSPNFSEVEVYFDGIADSAWRLPEISAIKQPPSLVVTPKYACGNILQIKDPADINEHVSVRLTECIDFSSFFIRYAYEILKQ